MQRARILVVDRHDAMRRHLRVTLEQESSWAVCGEATSVEDAIAQALATSPDITLFSTSTADQQVRDAVEEIASAVPTQVLVVSEYVDIEMRAALAASGARGYVITSDSPRTLVDAVSALLRRETFFPTRLADGAASVSSASDGALNEAQGPLSMRERQVVQLLSDGKSNKEIAAMLGIATKTVEVHRTRIMMKLKLHNLAALVRYAVRHGIVTP